MLPKSLNQYALQPRHKLTFNKSNQLGEGSYGCIYIVKLNDTPCIAKRLQDILMGRGSHEAVSKEEKLRLHEKFIQECMLMSQTNHPNIVKFIGVHFGVDQFDLTLFMEQLSTDLEKIPSRHKD